MKTIANGKRVTIQDVALSAGVAKSTVSQVLAGKGNFSEETRQRIQVEARKLRFQPDPLARRLSNGRFDSTVAMFTLGLDLNVGTQKIRLIQDLLIAEGFEVPLYACGRDASNSTAMVRSIRHQRPRAIAAHAAYLTPDTLRELRQYQEEGGIVVSYDQEIDLECDTVVFDREVNTYQATRHLLELGHRQIVFGHPGQDTLNNIRADGYRRALAEYGVVPQQDWYVGTESNHTLYEAAGAEIAANFLQLSPRPTAAYVASDYSAACFVAALERAGIRVPGDVSVVGHDDAPIARFGHLPLTTVTHPVDDIARGTVQLLVARIQGYEGPPRKIVIGSELVVRESTGPLS